MKVFIIAAITVDGMIGLAKDHHADWTSKEDKQLFVDLTKKAGVMVMGSNTFKTIGRGLPGRKTIVYAFEPSAIQGADGDVEWTDQDPKDLIDSLASRGYDSVAICGGAQIYSMFLGQQLVDELYLTVEPIIFGRGVKFADGIDIQKLELLDNSQLNHDSVLLHYKVLND